MERTITVDDIRVGDKIRLTRVAEGAVKRVTPDGWITIDNTNWDTRNINGRVNTLTLLERDIQLPTIPGSVILMTAPPGLAGVRWFLSGNTWVSAAGAVKTIPRFKEWLTLHNYTIEEVAL